MADIFLSKTVSSTKILLSLFFIIIEWQWYVLGFKSNRSLNESQLILQCCFALAMTVVDIALLILYELVHSGSRSKWEKNMIASSSPNLQIF